MASGRREAVKTLGVVEATKKAITTVIVQDFSRQHLGIGAATISNARVDDLGSPSWTLISSKPRIMSTLHQIRKIVMGLASSGLSCNQRRCGLCSKHAAGVTERLRQRLKPSFNQSTEPLPHRKRQVSGIVRSPTM